MIFERIKSEGLAHYSYLVGSGTSGAVIDPRRDCQVYLDFAQRYGLKIKHIFETHCNEDYVVGSLELSSLTGTEIFHGPGLDWKYGATLKDGQEFQIHALKLRAIHTPGHTDESMSYALADLSSGETVIVLFSGDTLFVDDVGRTDLYGLEDVPRSASHLYDSIHDKLLPLGDGAILCPAHGGGSICGSHIGDRDESSLGVERAQNPALQILDKRDFISYKIAECLEKPPYFARMGKYNLEGPPLLGHWLSPPPLTPRQFKGEMEKVEALVVDTRQAAAFGGAHIPGALNIWLEGLPSFAGWMLSYDRPVLLVLEDVGQLVQAVRALIRVGCDHIIGYLKDGISGWYSAGLPIESLPLLSVYELKQKMDSKEGLLVLDVRSENEWRAGHIPSARHIYVGYLPEKAGEVLSDRPVAVICSTGNRSGIAASVLLQAGPKNVFNVIGGMSSWAAACFPVTTD